MSVTHRISMMADAATQRYGLMLDGWARLYERAFNDTDFGSARQLARITSQAFDQIGNRYIETEIDHLTDDFFAIASDAYTATLSELSSDDQDDAQAALSEHVSALVSYSADELRRQMQRDFAFLVKTLRADHLSVALASRAQRITTRAAIIQKRIGESTSLDFVTRDRRNARWPSRRMVRAIWRQGLLTAYNDIVMMTLAEHGVETAQIRHNDPSSNWHGMTVSISPSADLPTYIEVRDEAFHPNAEAILVRAI